MITQYGMSERFGLIGLESIQSRYLDGRPVLNCGQETASEIDQEVMEDAARGPDEEAKRLLSEHRRLLTGCAGLPDREGDHHRARSSWKILREVEGDARDGRGAGQRGSRRRRASP